MIINTIRTSTGGWTAGIHLALTIKSVDDGRHTRPSTNMRPDMDIGRSHSHTVTHAVGMSYKLLTSILLVHRNHCRCCPGRRAPQPKATVFVRLDVIPYPYRMRLSIPNVFHSLRLNHIGHHHQ